MNSPEAGEGRRNTQHHWFSHWEELAVQEKILSCLLQWWLKHSVVSAYPQFVSANSQLAISCQICKQSLPSHLNKNVALNIINDAAFCWGNVSWKGCSKTSFIVGGGPLTTYNPTLINLFLQFQEIYRVAKWVQLFLAEKGKKTCQQLNYPALICRW